MVNVAAFWTAGLAAMYFLGLLGAGIWFAGSPLILGFELWRRYLAEARQSPGLTDLAGALAGG